MFVKEPNEDLFQAIFNHQWVKILEICDCELYNRSSLKIVDGFDHKGWDAVVSI